MFTIKKKVNTHLLIFIQQCVHCQPFFHFYDKLFKQEKARSYYISTSFLTYKLNQFKRLSYLITHISTIVFLVVWKQENISNAAKMFLKCLYHLYVKWAWMNFRLWIGNEQCIDHLKCHVFLSVNKNLVHIQAYHNVS